MSATTAMADAYDRISHDIGVQAFARRMLYLNDVSKIEAACRNNYGEVPSRKWIAAQLAEKNAKRVEHFYSSNDNTLHYNEDSDPGYWAPRGLIKPPPPPKKKPGPKPATIAKKAEPIDHRLSSKVLAAVADEFGLSVADILGKKRSRRLVSARFVVAKLLREVTWEDGRTRYSFPQIAKVLKKDCHTTIVHMWHTFEDRAHGYPEMWDAYRAVKASV